MAKDSTQTEGAQATPTVAGLQAENAQLRKRNEALAAELESSRVSYGAPLVVKMRMARVLGGRRYDRGAIIGHFTPHQGITAAEAEVAIRSHKTEFAEA